MVPAPPRPVVSLAHPARRRYPWRAPLTVWSGLCDVKMTLPELRVTVEALRAYRAPTVFDEDVAKTLVADLAGYVEDRYERMGVEWR